MSYSYKKRLFIGFVVFFVITFNHGASQALPPPSSNELCKIAGIVLEIGWGDGSNLSLKPIKIPTVKIRIKKIEKSKVSEPTHIVCNKFRPDTSHIFRNCDDFNFKIKSSVEGLIGRSIGGGPYCLENIKETPVGK